MADRRMGTVYRYAAMAALVVLLALVLLWPIAQTVRGGFTDSSGRFTLRYVREVFENPVLIEGLANSFRIAALTTVLAMALSIPLAMLAVRHDFAGRGLLSALLLVPLILPPFVGAIGLRAILGRFGALNALLAQMGVLRGGEPGFDFLGTGVAGVVAMEALHLFPIAYLNVAAALANIDPAMEEAALNLGAGPVRRFTRITLPLMLPGVFAGATLTLIWSFTELGTPLMFSYRRVTAVQVFEGLQELHSNPRPYALVVIMLAAAMLLYLAGRLVFGGRGYAMTGKATVAAGVRRLGPLGTVGAWLAFGAVIGAAILPHVGVVLNSLAVEGTWYRTVLPQRWTLAHFSDALTHPLAVGAIRNSLVYSLLATGLCVVVGSASALLVVRGKVVGGWLLDALVMLPLAVPGLVFAFGYAALSLAWPFGKDGPLAGWVSVFGVAPNPLLLLVVAYAVRRLPYVMRSVSAGLQQTSETLEEAALNLGASRWTTLRRVTLPLIAANVAAGTLLAFSFAMLEVSDSLVLAQKQAHYPVTKAIYDLYGRLGDGPYIASAMGVWAMALLTVTLVGASLLIGRRMGALFRVEICRGWIFVMPQPNILYMHSHDTGRYVQPYGYGIATPNLQRLAEQGVLFRQAFCAGPTCSPSRAALLLGQYPHQCGMLGLANLGWAIRDMRQHVVHALKAAGYTTALCGTQHIVTPPVSKIGYDEVVPIEPRGLVESACAWLRERGARRDGAFFLDLGHGLTHRHRYLEATAEENPGYLAPPAPMPDRPEVRADMARFVASCKQLDRDWGRVLAVLEETGLAENTLVICTTDHGIGWPAMKCTLHDGGLGVMLIMRYPAAGSSFRAGTVVDSLVSQIDIYPTLCDVLGITAPPWLEGRSLLPLLRGEAEAVREEVFAEINYHVAYQPERCVRTARYKYIRRFYDRLLPTQPNVDDGLSKALWQEQGWGEMPLGAEALYDLMFDPHEAHNVAGEARYGATLADLRGRLGGWMRQTDDPLLRGAIPRPSGGRIIEADEKSSAGPWLEIP